MHKVLMIALIVVAGLSVEAQHWGDRDRFKRNNSRYSLSQMAQHVSGLIQRYENNLRWQEKREVYEALVRIQQLFPDQNGGHPGRGHKERNLTCDSSDNRLVDLANGSTIHDFSILANCEEAKSYVKAGEYFCDYSTNILYTSDARKVHDFSSQSDCRTARVAAQQGQRFCDYNDNTLRDADGRLVHDFNSESDCRKALGSY